MNHLSKFQIFRRFLLPFSFLYGIIIVIRHKLFDWKIFKSVSFNLPVICIGNITVGGTGKTPHIEYLVELLQKDFSVATLSRGYKRKTTGYILANKKTTPETIGDEPFQIFSKFNDIYVAVAEKRVVGINELQKDCKDLQVVLLDDAFQHRHVKPGLNIVLIDFNQPVFEDRLLPAGNLRDLKSQLKRADIVIVSKTPKSIKGIEKRLWIKELNIFPYQKLFFSYIKYGLLTSVFNHQQKSVSLGDLGDSKTEVLLVTGIANPSPLIDKLKKKEIKHKTLIFPDHHNFSPADIERILHAFEGIDSKYKIVLTTEKDAVRLRTFKKELASIQQKCYYLPIEVDFLDNGKKEFDKIILNYVRKNKRIGRIY